MRMPISIASIAGILPCTLQKYERDNQESTHTRLHPPNIDYDGDRCVLCSTPDRARSEARASILHHHPSPCTEHQKHEEKKTTQRASRWAHQNTTSTRHTHPVVDFVCGKTAIFIGIIYKRRPPIHTQHTPTLWIDNGSTRPVVYALTEGLPYYNKESCLNEHARKKFNDSSRAVGISQLQLNCLNRSNSNTAATNPLKHHDHRALTYPPSFRTALKKPG